MAKVTIADLDAAGALDGTELVEIEQGGESKQTTTQDIADLGGGGAGYLVYTALLTQTDTDAPVATVLENTLGGTVVWTRQGQGIYFGALAGAFTPGKTWCNYSFGDGDSGVVVVFFSNSVDTVYMQQVDGSVSGGSSVDGFSSAGVEIRVYP